MNQKTSHVASAICIAPAERVFAHLTSAPGMSRWCLGMTECIEVSPGLLLGRSLFDGSSAYARIDADALRLTVDYYCGGSPESLAPRIHGRVVRGASLGYADDRCMATLLAWRPAGMSDERWWRLKASHETEILLVREQLESGAAR